MMKDYFQNVSDDEDFRQGDLICPYQEPHAGLPAGSVGVIITADCDIDKDKFGGYYSYLSVVPAEAYLDTCWASGRVQTFVADTCDSAIELLHRIQRENNSKCDRLPANELLDWLAVRGADKVLASLNVAPGQERQILEGKLKILTIAHQTLLDDPYPNISRLKKIWRVSGIAPDDRKKALRRAFNEMNQSFFLIPELPHTAKYGYVITLRDVRSIHESEVYPTRGGMPFHKASSQSMHRVGRFSDRIRFAIAQKFASLFSRIGMTTPFERDCKDVPELIIDTLDVHL